MGLDQYAYITAKAGDHAAFYKDGEFNSKTGEWDNPNMFKPQELCYWRKHPNLQGWMSNLYHSRGGTETFNGVELELTWEDVDKLEKDIKKGRMAELGTTGFFFGDPSDDYYKERDLQFCIDAKTELFLGRKVFYNSSW